ncbi:LnmK family bifunctional acyltransferase/decarboxylase [Sandaracinobacteroides hominis]|uniref:LnmK family bifunctional acyltransferase/decarboxylase n=1 Tax=Sandaracinobacteroides hominis TaxID=2780086 RepID=UPI0018F4DFA4|nr:LnmK family bifunctional acyltransferase/decarboxylase [Sandaracinobacteroides hominis]
MGLVRNLTDRAMVRLHSRREYESPELRAYFKQHYDIEVGLYTIGAFDRWRIPPGSRIGRYCSIARSSRLLDADHPISALSTHPYFYLGQFGLVGKDQLHLIAPVIEDDVWIGHNAIITPSCNHIGRGAIVGAGAVVTRDVPPYAIVTGAPGKLARFRFDPDTIAVIEASRWWELSREELAAAGKAAPLFLLQPSRETAAPFFAHLGRDLPPPYVYKAESASPLARAGKAELLTLLKTEIPDFDEAHPETPFNRLSIDSFGLITLRIGIEQLIGGQISDREWGALQSPADLLSLAGSTTTAAPAAKPKKSVKTAAAPSETVTTAGTRPASEARRQVINMPQMAMRGLSESWLFKEMGDLHWHTLCKGLETPSSAIADSEGSRLYATFTRIRLELQAPLTDFRENQELLLDLAPSRFGAGMFFGDIEISGETATAHASLMTSFSKFGEAGANTSLMKGQPVIPEGCEIPSLTAAPEFAAGYRALRAEELPPALFETSYEMQPVHDINGVGLLYFAAYPMIADICAARHFGPELLSRRSTTLRDICYFANAMPDEILVYRLHAEQTEGDRLRYRATLSRKSDGKTMALIETEKQTVDLPPIK